ncbi:hypothetical protein SB816_32310, partial [Achromobacter sp. SIMBA_011]|uniref:hypothetical protein n=1 Tax=Achromobacter sp. SIMBA_011 TaxID=3085759 RepID=UPI003979BE4C
IEVARIAPSAMTTFEHCIHTLDASMRLPRTQRRFIELDEDALAVNLIRRNPIRLAAREARHLRALVWIIRFLGRFHASET